MNRSSVKGPAHATLAAVLLMLITACVTTPDSSGAANQETNTGVNVGVVLSLTGAASSLGVPEGDTVELYVEQLGQAGDHPVDWIVRDDRSDQTTAVTIARELIEQENVDALICCTTSPISLAVLPIAQEAGVPMIALGAASAIANPVDERKWIFKTAVPDTIIAAVDAAHMAGHGYERVAFLGFDDGYGESGNVQFGIAAEEAGITVSGEQSFPADATDVTAELVQLQQTDPDAYLIWAIPPGAVVAQKDLRSLGIEAPVYQSHGAANQDFIDLGGAAVEGTFLGVPKLIVAQSLPESELKASILDYKQQYEEAYGEPINVFGAETLDAMLIIHEALKRAVENGDPSDLGAFRSLVRDEIEATENHVGITGVYTYSPTDHEGLDERCCTVATVENGEYVPAE